MRGWPVVTTAVGTVLAVIALGGAGWILSRPVPDRMVIDDASVVRVIPVELAAGVRVRQRVPDARGASSLAVPYRLERPGAARAILTVADVEGTVLARQDVGLVRTDRVDLGRLFAPSNPWGSDTELMTVHLAPAAADEVVLTIELTAGSPAPVLLETEAGYTSLPPALGTPGVSVNLLMGRGSEKPAIEKLPLYLDRIGYVAAGWMPPPALVALIALLVVGSLAVLAAAAGGESNAS